MVCCMLERNEKNDLHADLGGDSSDTFSRKSTIYDFNTRLQLHGRPRAGSVTVGFLVSVPWKAGE